MKTLLEIVAENGELQGRMYQDYRAYMIRKGVDEDNLMSFSQWQSHLGIVPVHMKYLD